MYWIGTSVSMLTRSYVLIGTPLYQISPQSQPHFFINLLTILEFFCIKTLLYNVRPSLMSYRSKLFLQLFFATITNSNIFYLNFKLFSNTRTYIQTYNMFVVLCVWIYVYKEDFKYKEIYNTKITKTRFLLYSINPMVEFDYVIF